MLRPEAALDLGKTMLDELEDYLLSPELFWPIHRRPARGQPVYPRLTLGGLLLTLDELEALRPELSPAQAAALERLRGRWQTAQARSPAAIEKKALQELGARLNLWEAYLNELQEGPGAVQDYATEVRLRVMASRLLALIAGAADLDRTRERWHVLDRTLRSRFQAGEFAWDGRLSRVYDSDRFWFLYGSPLSTAS